MKEAARMKRLPITDAQVDLVAERLRAVGVGRREFLKVAAGLAAMGSAGFNVRPVAAAPKLAPGETLAKDQTFRYGGGGWWQDDPTSQDFNKDLYCNGVPALFAGLMKFNADHQAVLYVASKVRSEEHTSELQSLTNLVCRLLLEKKKEQGLPLWMGFNENDLRLLRNSYAAARR